MAYYRTLKNGERRLIYTAKDRQVQAERRAVYYLARIPDFAAFPTEPHRNFTRRDVEHFWWWNNYSPNKMAVTIENQRNLVAELRTRLALTLKRERRVIDANTAWHIGAICERTGAVCYASAGYASDVRRMLDRTLHDLRQMEMAFNCFCNSTSLFRHNIGGASFSAPYHR